MNICYFNWFQILFIAFVVDLDNKIGANSIRCTSVDGVCLAFVHFVVFYLRWALRTALNKYMFMNRQSSSGKKERLHCYCWQCVAVCCAYGSFIVLSPKWISFSEFFYWVSCWVIFRWTFKPVDHIYWDLLLSIFVFVLLHHAWSSRWLCIIQVQWINFFYFIIYSIILH